MQKLPDKLYIASQVKEIEQRVIEDGGVSGLDLMHKAGRAVFDLIKKQYANYELAVFCGAGNNAGDGYVVAKLALEQGFTVTVYSVSNPQMLKGDTLIAYQQYIMASGKLSPFNLNIHINEQSCIVVDALLGTGLNRQVTDYYADAIAMINQFSNSVVSVDIPSGLNADTGHVMGCAVKANWTVSFVKLKQGLFTGFAAEYCGKIIYSSIDIANEGAETIECSSRLITSHCIPRRHRCGHKGHYGHVLVIGGEVGFPGAVRLSAEAALRVGAGLVSVATRKNHAHLINLVRPELMCYEIGRASFLQPLLDKATVIVIGPGLGQSQWAKELLQKTIDSDKPLVCDADALNIVADENRYLNNWVLTPHPGEASRLLECTTEDIANNRFLAVSNLQKKFGGVVLLKGAGTLINNGVETSISITGNPGMASGGMGDTLAGMIGGLIAQKMALYDASTSSAFIHGKAADLAAREDGEIGMLASDLMPFIRKLVNQ